MCGITGFNWKDEKLVKKTSDTIKHRGPDDSGTFSDKNVSLGHRRLSIIDLSKKGRQPMSDKENTVQIVFNGEIYNFQEIRAELEKKHKCKFRTNTDTEVIIQAYKIWGITCLNKFNGMWAFCIYDKKKQKLVLSRDRLGQKPLYYYFDGEKFIFGSELKTILAHDVPRDITKDALDFFFTIGFIPSPFCIYNNMNKLEARQVIEFDIKKRKISKKYYYNIPKYRPTYNKKKLITESKKLLKDATRLRLISDVPVGAFLSGGLDSSAVVAQMADFVDLKKLHTFSIGFEGKYDESKYIHIVRKYLGTKHHHKYYKEKNFTDMMEKISEFYDEPFADYSNFPTYEVSKLARKNVTVSLSGDGGDEIFGGYTFHHVVAKLAIIRVMPRFLRKSIVSLISKKSPFTLLKVKEIFKISLVEPEDFYVELGSDLAYKPEVFKKWTRKKMKEILNSCGGNLREAIIRYDLYYNTLADNFLTKVDRASMANALEVRCPFLDYRFVELESRIPTKWKATPFRTKVLMREVIKDMLPKQVVYRGKQGFEPPLKEWTKTKNMDRTLREGLEELKEKNIINDKWYSFYKYTVFKKNNFVYQNFKIRLLLLLKWWDKWIVEKK